MAVKSFREATLSQPGGDIPQSNRFWHDGAFTNFTLRFDMFTQLLLQQMNSQQELVDRRLQPSLSLSAPSEPGTSPSLTLAAGLAGEVDFFASRVFSTWLLGDYIGTILNCRVFLSVFTGTNGPINDLLTSKGATQDRIATLQYLIEGVESFAERPQFDPTLIVLLASACPALVEQVMQVFHA